MKILHISLGSLLVFVGLNAVIAGFMFMLDPTGKTMGLPLDVLSKSPFSNYLIPGIILFTVNGLGSFAGAFLAFTKNKYTGVAGAGLGTILCGWILIQVMWIDYSWMQTTIFIVGCIEFILSLLILKKMMKKSKGI
jgi:hypothetical protein